MTGDLTIRINADVSVWHNKLDDVHKGLDEALEALDRLSGIVDSRNKTCRFCGRVFTSARQYYEDHIGSYCREMRSCIMYESTHPQQSERP